MVVVGMAREKNGRVNPLVRICGDFALQRTTLLATDSPHHGV